jgi:hypothetical protein
MATSGLSKDWVVMPAFDPELKRYILLAYLQRVGARFAERKLYPHLEELHAHVTQLIQLRRSKEDLARSIPGRLTGFDRRTGEPIYQRQEEDEMMAVIDEVLDFAIPGLRQALADGRELKEEISQQIRFTPIGVQPLRATEGWLLLRTGREARVYGYSMPLFRESADELQYRSVHTRYVTSYVLGISCTYEHIKAELRERHRDLPNPATYVFEADLTLPHIETFMPLAKQLVYEHVAAAMK